MRKRSRAGSVQSHMSTLGLLDGGCINGAGFLADLTDRDLSRDLRSFAVVAQRTTKIKHLSPFVHKKEDAVRIFRME
ncbi:uncharacterized protein LOC105164962 isoform X4 [Sesamum indicum]|uniref:Uncharacterized protein LOC105164962 isoform X4 n=1 Tax=Sesamum indicum TaxID=4182 RepID=A0A6I9TBK9_SESIN|nr:uncharacterized protein LOC105164962 isoform X4 [Sesamum indicum]